MTRVSWLWLCAVVLVAPLAGVVLAAVTAWVGVLVR